jgi:hypothetical protein
MPAASDWDRVQTPHLAMKDCLPILQGGIPDRFPGLPGCGKQRCVGPVPPSAIQGDHDSPARVGLDTGDCCRHSVAAYLVLRPWYVVFISTIFFGEEKGFTGQGHAETNLDKPT